MPTESPNPRGWDELNALARAHGLQQVLLSLRERGIFLELAGGRAELVTAQPAPDGEYALLVSGRIVVKGGRFLHVTGTPSAPAAGALSP